MFLLLFISVAILLKYRMTRMTSIVLFAAALFLAVLLPAGARAEVVTITKSYTYTASPFESLESSQVVALAKAKLLVFNAVAARVGGADEAAALAPGTVRVQEGAHSWNGSEYRAEAYVSMDPEVVAARLDDLAADPHRAEELRDLRKRAAEALGGIEALKKDGDPGEYARYDEMVKELVAVDSVERGYAALAAGSYPAAEKHFTKAIGIDPLDAQARYNRGVARWLLEDYQKAVGDFRRAFEINPGYERAERSLEQAEEFFKKLKATVKYYDRAIAVDPSEVDLYYERGVAHWQLGNYDEAIRDFTVIARMNPGVEDGFVNRGGVHLSMEEYHAAMKDLEAAININPRSSAAHFNLGLVYLKLGMTEEAIKSFGRAIEINPSDSEALFNRGVLYEEKGSRAKALADMRAAASLGHQGAREFLVAEGLEPPEKTQAEVTKAAAGADAPREMPSREKPAAESVPKGEDMEDSASPGGKAAYAIQAGAFSTRENAEEYAAKLKKRGYPSYVRVSSSRSKSPLHFVIVGNYFEKSKAEETLRRLKAEDINGFIKVLK